MLSTRDFENFLLSLSEIRSYINKRIKDLERKYIPSLSDENFSLRELLSNNAALQLFIEEIVPRRLRFRTGIKKQLTLEDKVNLFLQNIRRHNIPTPESENVEDKFMRILDEVKKIASFRQEYAIAIAEIERYKGTGFLAILLSRIKVDGVLIHDNTVLRLDSKRIDNSQVYIASEKLYDLDTFFKQLYFPLINNYLNAIAIKKTWEEREGLISELLKRVPREIIKLIVGASRSPNWFIEVGDIGLERRGDTYYLYQWTEEFALIEILNDAHKGELYLFPRFKVGVPFRFERRKLKIFRAVVLDPPILHPFIPSSPSSIKEICLGKNEQAYSNIARRGTVEALLGALEMAVIMILDGYGHGASPFRNACECGAKRVDYKYLVKRGIRVTNTSDEDARKLLRRKWGAKI